MSINVVGMLEQHGLAVQCHVALEFLSVCFVRCVIDGCVL